MHAFVRRSVLARFINESPQPNFGTEMTLTLAELRAPSKELLDSLHRKLLLHSYAYHTTLTTLHVTMLHRKLPLNG